MIPNTLMMMGFWLLIQTPTTRAHISKAKPPGGPTHLEACPLESSGPRNQASGVHLSHLVSASAWSIKRQLFS